MNKQEFLDALKEKLADLPYKDVSERLGFYSESIDDRIEEGLSESDAVSEIGSVEKIASQIIADITTDNKDRKKKSDRRKGRVTNILLLSLGSPVWIALMASAFAVIISLLASLWSVVASAWAIFASAVACAPGGVVIGIIHTVTGSALSGFALIGAGIFCAGFAIALLYGSLKATQGVVYLTVKAAVLTKGITLFIIGCFRGKKEVAQ